MFVLPGCQQNSRPERIVIKIIETTDVHGAIFPYDLISDQATQHSLAQVYSYVEQQRNQTGQEVILLDNGDILQGDPLIYYYNFERNDEPHIVSQVMNFMKYDAATVGNHDIEPGPAVYNKVLNEFNFPWMAANAVDQKTKESFFKPYTIIERQGVRIAVLGLITPAIPKWLPEYTWEGLEFQDMIEAANLWVEKIQQNEKPDLLIGLFHAGVDYTYANQDENTRFNENASLLIAEQVPGFDVIFVGHDHHGWNKWASDFFGSEVLILGALNGARNVAVANITLTLDKSTNSYTKEITGEIVVTDPFEPHQAFMSLFRPAFDNATDYVVRPIGELTTTLSTRPVFFGDAAFTDLIHQVQLDLTGADISFASSNSFDLEIKPGVLLVRDMFTFHRYENLLYTMTLTGQEIKDYLEYSAGLWFNQMTSSSDHLLLMKKDENGNILLRKNNTASLQNPFWNLDAAEGIIYTVDVSMPVGARIKISKMVNGEPFELQKIYKVAVNSYRGNGGGDHLTVGAGIPVEELNARIVFSTEKDLRWHTVEWIEKKGAISPVSNSNWKVVPEKWVMEAWQKDQLLLFGGK
ncbi:MAG: bifunctional metallophosphatase/5'-nucleotidase [Bacteroidales bacterium]|nr:bifunctional metallophosphatase/5'-nucleotidase [Bacteroidales bacterium]